ncbi:MAG: Hsp20/alpha crystallin family protein [Spirochaetota bacterium]
MFGLAKKNQETAQVEKNAAAADVTYVPAVDITEGEAGYTIFADVPGANKDSVSVTFEDGVVTLKAQSAAEAVSSDLIRREFRFANYERAFRVSDDVDADKISAEIANGVLQVTLPRKASAKKMIPVSVK